MFNSLMFKTNIKRNKIFQVEDNKASEEGDKLANRNVNANGNGSNIESI